MEKVLYAKYSNQRKREFAISTIIIENNAEKYVLKKALYPKENVHLMRMVDSYAELQNIFQRCGWLVAPCMCLEEGVVRFSFISGKTLEDIIKIKLFDDDFNGVCDILMDFSEQVYNNEKINEFQMNEGFLQLFGEVSFSNTLHAFCLSNVDMIFSNLIVNDDKYVIVDYEWVFDFMIPIEFILFRSVFHDATLQKLNDEKKKKIYQCLRISENDIELFEKLEYIFQDYVKGEYRDINQIYKAINNKVIPLECVKIDGSVNSYSIEADGINIIRQNSLQTDIYIDVDGMEEFVSITLNLNSYNGIYKLKYAYGMRKCEKEDLELIESNYNLCRSDDYYFVNSNPTMVFKNNKCQSIHICYSILTKDNNMMSNIVEALERTTELYDALTQYKERADEYEVAYNKVNEDCIQYRDAYEEYKAAYETVSTEMEVVRSSILWKIGDKIKSVRKK